MLGITFVIVAYLRKTTNLMPPGIIKKHLVVHVVLTIDNYQYTCEEQEIKRQ